MERHIRRNGRSYTVREERSKTGRRWIYVVYTAEGERLFGTRVDGAGIYSRLDVLHAADTREKTEAGERK